MEVPNHRGVAKLVLGYLLNNSNEEVCLAFCKYSEYLEDEYNQLLDGCMPMDIPMAGNLVQIVSDFCQIQGMIYRAESLTSFGKRRLCHKSLVEKLEALLALSVPDIKSQFAIGKRRRQSLGVDAQRSDINSDDSYGIEQKRRRLESGTPDRRKSVTITSPIRDDREGLVRTELRSILKTPSHSNISSKPLPPPEQEPVEIAPDRSPEPKPETETPRTNSISSIISNIPKDGEALRGQLDLRQGECSQQTASGPPQPPPLPSEPYRHQPPLPANEPIAVKPPEPSPMPSNRIPALRREYSSPFSLTDSTASHSESTATTSGSSVIDRRISLDAHLSPIQPALGPDGKMLREVLDKEIFENPGLAEMLASNINSILEDDDFLPQAQDPNEANNASKKSESEQLEDVIQNILAKAEREPLFDDIIHGIGGYLPMNSAGLSSLNKSVPGLMTASTPHKSHTCPPHKTEGSAAATENSNAAHPPKQATTPLPPPADPSADKPLEAGDWASPSPKPAKRVLRPRQQKDYNDNRTIGNPVKALKTDQSLLVEMKAKHAKGVRPQGKRRVQSPTSQTYSSIRKYTNRIQKLEKEKEKQLERLKVNIISNETFEGYISPAMLSLVQEQRPIEPMYTYVLEPVEPSPKEPEFIQETDPVSGTSSLKQKIVITQPHGCNYPMFNPNPIVIPTPVCPPPAQQVEYIIDIPANIFEKSPIKEMSDADMMIPDSISKLIVPYSTKKFHHRNSVDDEEVAEVERAAAGASEPQKSVSTDKENSVPAAAEKATQTPKLSTIATQKTKCASSPRKSHVRVLNFDSPSRNALRSPRQPSTLPKLNDSSKMATTPVITFTSPRSSILTRSATKITKKDADTPKVPKRIRKRLLNHQPMAKGIAQKVQVKKRVVKCREPAKKSSPKKRAEPEKEESVAEPEQPKPMDAWIAMREGSKSKNWDNQLRLQLSSIPTLPRAGKPKKRKKAPAKQPVDEEDRPAEKVIGEALDDPSTSGNSKQDAAAGAKEEEEVQDNSLDKEMAKEMKDFLLNKSEDCVDISVTDVSRMDETVLANRGNVTIASPTIPDSDEPKILPNLEASLVKNPDKVMLPNLDATLVVEKGSGGGQNPNEASEINLTNHKAAEKVHSMEEVIEQPGPEVQNKSCGETTADPKPSQVETESSTAAVIDPDPVPPSSPTKSEVEEPTLVEERATAEVDQNTSPTPVNPPMSPPVPPSPKVKPMRRTRSGDKLDPMDGPMKAPAPSSSAYISPPPTTPALSKSGNASHLFLETPRKEGLDLIPPTPGFVRPHLTPAAKVVKTIICQNVSVLKCSDIPTPDFAITPGVNLTPERGESPRAKRPTDYSSSGSSYYKPDDSDDMNKIIDARVAAARLKTKSESDTQEGVMKVVVEEEKTVITKTVTFAEEKVARPTLDPVIEEKDHEESSSSSDESTSESSSSDESYSSESSEMDISDEENNRSMNGSKRRLIAENGRLDRNNQIRFSPRKSVTPRKDRRDPETRRSTQSPQVSSSSSSSTKPPPQPIPGTSSERSRVASTKAISNDRLLADLEEKRQRIMSTLGSEQTPKKKSPSTVTIIQTKSVVTAIETRISSTSSKRKSATPRKIIALDELPAQQTSRGTGARNNGSGSSEVAHKSLPSTRQQVSEKTPIVPTVSRAVKVPITNSTRKKFENVFGDISDSETDPTPVKTDTQDLWKTPKVVEKTRPTKKSPVEMPEETLKKAGAGKPESKNPVQMAPGILDAVGQNVDIISTSHLKSILETVHSTSCTTSQRKSGLAKETPPSELAPKSIEEEIPPSIISKSRESSKNPANLANKGTMEKSIPNKNPAESNPTEKIGLPTTEVVHSDLRLPVIKDPKPSTKRTILIDPSELAKKGSAKKSSTTRNNSKADPAKASSSKSSKKPAAPAKKPIGKKEEKKLEEYLATEKALRNAMMKSTPTPSVVKATESKEPDKAKRSIKPSSSLESPVAGPSKTVNPRPETGEKIRKEKKSKSQPETVLKGTETTDIIHTTSKSTKDERSTKPIAKSKPVNCSQGPSQPQETEIRSVPPSQPAERPKGTDHCPSLEVQARADSPTRLLASQVNKEDGETVQNNAKIVDKDESVSEAEEGEIVEENLAAESSNHEVEPPTRPVEGSSDESPPEPWDLVSLDETSSYFHAAVHDPQFQPSGSWDLSRVDLALRMKIFPHDDDSFAVLSIMVADGLENKPVVDEKVSSSSKKSSKVAKQSRTKMAPAKQMSSSSSAPSMRSPITNFKKDQIDLLLNRLHGDEK